MSHPLVLALFNDAAGASRAAQAVRALGVGRDDLSIVARSHEAEGWLAERVGASPGVEIEDSAAAATLGDLSGHILAAIATVLPGVGPIVAGGPLAAGLGEAAGHLAGGLGSMLKRSGVAAEEAEHWERAIENGSVLLGVHIRQGDEAAIRSALEKSHATNLVTINYAHG